MQKLLIIDNNIEYIQKIMCGISSNINKVKTHCFYREKDNKIIDLIENKEIDIIIINIEIDQLDIVEYISKNNIKFKYVQKANLSIDIQWRKHLGLVTVSKKLCN